MPKTKRKTAPKITPPTRQQVLAVSIGVAGIAGWLVDSKLVALLAAYINGDEESGQIALDRAHELGLHEGGALPVEVKWPKIKPHEHTWLSWVRGDDERAMRTAAAAYGAISALPCTIRRCTCGLFEHEPHFEPLDCEDRRCDIPRGHAGAHYTRWVEGHNNIGEESWDRDAAEDIAPYLGH